jgi:hypothetical protein
MGPFNSDFIISVTSESGRFLTSSIPAQPPDGSPKSRAGGKAAALSLIMTIPRAAAARRPTRIVKLIRHAKSTDAAHGFPALLNGEEAAICAAHTRRILSTPSSIIAGQSGSGRLR